MSEVWIKVINDENMEEISSKWLSYQVPKIGQTDGHLEILSAKALKQNGCCITYSKGNSLTWVKMEQSDLAPHCLLRRLKKPKQQTT